MSTHPQVPYWETGKGGFADGSRDWMMYRCHYTHYLTTAGVAIEASFTIEEAERTWSLDKAIWKMLYLYMSFYISFIRIPVNEDRKLRSGWQLLDIFFAFSGNNPIQKQTRRRELRKREYRFIWAENLSVDYSIHFLLTPSPPQFTCPLTVVSSTPNTGILKTLLGCLNVNAVAIVYLVALPLLCFSFSTVCRLLSTSVIS